MRLILIAMSIVQFSIASEKYIIAYGDSISAGAMAKFQMKQNVNRSGSWFTFPKLAWSTGEGISSLYVNIKNHYKLDELQSLNYAQGGSTTIDTFPKVHESIKTYGSKIMLGTFMIGPNNFCNEGDHVFDDPKGAANIVYLNIRYFLRKTNAHAILTDMAPVDQLIKYKYHKGALGLSCKTIWKYFWSNVCGPIFKRLSSDDKASDAWLEMMVESFRHEWQKVAIKLENEFGDRFMYVPLFESHETKYDQISSDCFHPSKKGQETIARQVFEQVKVNNFLNF